MPFIDPLPFDTLPDDVRAMYKRQQEHYGYVPNYALVFGHRPEVLERWATLQASIKRHQDRKQFELLTFVAAVTLGSTLCARAHGRKLCEYLSPQDVQTLARGETPSCCSPAEAAMISFARTVARDANAVSRRDVALLKQHGFGHAEIFDMAATVAGRAFWTKIIESLGVDADVETQPDDAFAQALTVGRSPVFVPPRQLRGEPPNGTASPEGHASAPTGPTRV
jgi:uncharacterized peroxidase-related enzyme